MSFPIICMTNGHRFTVQQVTADLCCFACDSTDLDFDEGPARTAATKKTASSRKTASIQWTGDTHMGVGFLSGKASNGDVYEVYSNPNSNPAPCAWVNYGPDGDSGPNSGIAAGRGFTTMQEAVQDAEAHDGGTTASKKTADFNDPEMAEVGDVDAVKQNVTCSTCLTDHVVTATDPAQPMPACPNCGNMTLSPAGGTLASRRQAEVTREVYKGTSKDFQNNTTSPPAWMLDGLVGKLVQLICFNDDGVATEYYRGRIVSHDDDEIDWQQIGVAEPYPIATSDIYSITRLEEPAPQSEMLFSSCRQAGSLDAAFASLISRGDDLRQTKISEIVSGVMATNPGMNATAARQIAEKTVQRYPNVIQGA